MPSHADIHDLDKLDRWQKDLAVAAPDAPPVFAIFLVSESDKTAHDIFRAFRSSFESRNAGFAHLVIFGQHGVSDTVNRLLAELNLPPDSRPTLALFTGSAEAPATIISLPVGNPPYGAPEPGSVLEPEPGPGPGPGSEPEPGSEPGSEPEPEPEDGASEGHGSEIPWQTALRRAEEVFDSGGAALHTVSTVAEDEVIDRATNGTLAGALTDMVRRILAE